MKRILSVLGLLLAYVSSQAQMKEVSAADFPKSVVIGQPCPEIKFDDLYNSDHTSGKLSDYKGQWLVIAVEAWGEDIYYLNSLNTKFTGKVRFLVTTGRRLVAVKNDLHEFDSVSTTGPIRLPIFYHDNTFSDYFPPGYVCIDPKGVVRAVTSKDQLTAGNLEKMISGELTGLPVLDHGRLSCPALLFDKREKELQGSIISRYKIGLNDYWDHYRGASFEYAVLGGSGVGENGRPPVELFNLAGYKYGFGGIYSNSVRFAPGIPFDIYAKLNYYGCDSINMAHLYPNIPYSKQLKDSLEKAAYAYKYCISYEMVAPDKILEGNFSSGGAYGVHGNKIMGDRILKDANEIFGKLYGVEGVISEEKTSYYALVATGTSDSYKAKKDQPAGSTNSAFGMHCNGAGASVIIKDLVFNTTQNHKLDGSSEITDETGNKDGFALDFTCDMSDLNAVRTNLQKAGLDLVVKTKVSKVILIRMKDKNKTKS